MEGIQDLVERLRAAGVPVDEGVAEAMGSVDTRDVPDHDTELFLIDRPGPFLVTPTGAAQHGPPGVAGR